MTSVPYGSVVGNLMYDMVCTRPDITHAVGIVRRYMKNHEKTLGSCEVASKISKSYM